MTSEAHLTGVSVVLEATHKVRFRAVEGYHISSNSLEGSKAETRELLGRMEVKSISPMKGH